MGNGGSTTAAAAFDAKYRARCRCAELLDEAWSCSEQLGGILASHDEHVKDAASPSNHDLPPPSSPHSAAAAAASGTLPRSSPPLSPSALPSFPRAEPGCGGAVLLPLPAVAEESAGCPATRVFVVGCSRDYEREFYELQGGVGACDGDGGGGISPAEEVRRAARLSAFLEAFASDVEPVVERVVAELHLPPAKRTYVEVPREPAPAAARLTRRRLLDSVLGGPVGGDAAAVSDDEAAVTLEGVPAVFYGGQPLLVFGDGEDGQPAVVGGDEEGGEGGSRSAPSSPPQQQPPPPLAELPIPATSRLSGFSFEAADYTGADAPTTTLLGKASSTAKPGMDEEPAAEAGEEEDEDSWCPAWRELLCPPTAQAAAEAAAPVGLHPPRDEAAFYNTVLRISVVFDAAEAARAAKAHRAGLAFLGCQASPAGPFASASATAWTPRGAGEWGGVVAAPVSALFEKNGVSVAVGTVFDFVEATGSEPLSPGSAAASSPAAEHQRRTRVVYGLKADEAGGGAVVLDACEEAPLSLQRTLERMGLAGRVVQTAGEGACTFYGPDELTVEAVREDGRLYAFGLAGLVPDAVAEGASLFPLTALGVGGGGGSGGGGGAAPPSLRAVVLEECVPKVASVLLAMPCRSPTGEVAVDDDAAGVVAPAGPPRVWIDVLEEAGDDELRPTVGACVGVAKLCADFGVGEDDVEFLYMFFVELRARLLELGPDGRTTGRPDAGANYYGREHGGGGPQAMDTFVVAEILRRQPRFAGGAKEQAGSPSSSPQLRAAAMAGVWLSGDASSGEEDAEGEADASPQPPQPSPRAPPGSGGSGAELPEAFLNDMRARVWFVLHLLAVVLHAAAIRKAAAVALRAEVAAGVRRGEAIGAAFAARPFEEATEETARAAAARVERDRENGLQVCGALHHVLRTFLQRTLEFDPGLLCYEGRRGRGDATAATTAAAAAVGTEQGQEPAPTPRQQPQQRLCSSAYHFPASPTYVAPCFRALLFYHVVHTLGLSSDSESDGTPGVLVRPEVRFRARPPVAVVSAGQSAGATGGWEPLSVTPAGHVLSTGTPDLVGVDPTSGPALPASAASPRRRKKNVAGAGEGVGRKGLAAASAAAGQPPRTRAGPYPLLGRDAEQRPGPLLVAVRQAPYTRPLMVGRRAAGDVRRWVLLQELCEAYTREAPPAAAAAPVGEADDDKPAKIGLWCRGGGGGDGDGDGDGSKSFYTGYLLDAKVRRGGGALFTAWAEEARLQELLEGQRQRSLSVSDLNSGDGGANQRSEEEAAASEPVAARRIVVLADTAAEETAEPRLRLLGPHLAALAARVVGCRCGSGGVPSLSVQGRERCEELLRSAVHMRRQAGASALYEGVALAGFLEACGDIGAAEETAAQCAAEAAEGGGVAAGLRGDLLFYEARLHAAQGAAGRRGAASRMSDALRCLSTAHGAASARLAPCLAAVAGLYEAQGMTKAAEGIRAYVLAVHLREQAAGCRTRAVAAAVNNLAVNLCRQKRAHEAEPLLLYSWATSLRVLGARHIEAAAPLKNLCRAYGDQGLLERCLVLRRVELEAVSLRCGAMHPDTAASQTNLAEAYATLGMMNEATVGLRTALGVCLHAFEEGHARIADAQRRLASLLLEAGDVQGSLEHSRAAVGSLQTRRGDHWHHRVQGAMVVLRRGLEAAGLEEEAEECGASLEEIARLCASSGGQVPDAPQGLYSLL